MNEISPSLSYSILFLCRQLSLALPAKGRCGDDHGRAGRFDAGTCPRACPVCFGPCADDSGASVRTFGDCPPPITVRSRSNIKTTTPNPLPPAPSHPLAHRRLTIYRDHTLSAASHGHARACRIPGNTTCKRVFSISLRAHTRPLVARLHPSC